MNYGMPYKGSKNKCIKWLIDLLPAGNVFVDLFGGGGAVSHAALLSGKYKRVIYNELEPIVAKGFDMAVHGRFSDEDRWISREDFHRLKDTDPYVAICFSFGNNMKEYCYSAEIEPWKRALHYARKFGDFSEFDRFGIKTDGTRFDIIAHKDEYKALYIKWYMKNVMKSDAEYRIEKAELEKNIKDESDKLRAYLISARDAAGLKSSDVDKYLGTNGMAGHYFGRSQWQFPTRDAYIRMQEIMPALDQDFDNIAGLYILWQSLERLQSLQRLQRLQSLETYNLDYREVEIPKGAVVYCDIPYKSTSEYLTGFDHEAFYEWARTRDFDVYISEYDMPSDFCEVDNVVKQCAMSAVSSKKTLERLYCNHKVQSYIFEQLCFPLYEVI